MDSYLLILHEVPDDSEEKLSSVVDVIVRLGGGNRSQISQLVKALPVILCEHLTGDEVKTWEAALEEVGASVEVIPETAQDATAAALSAAPAFVAPADVGDLEQALEDLISGTFPSVDDAVGAKPAAPPPVSPVSTAATSTAPRVVASDTPLDRLAAAANVSSQKTLPNFQIPTDSSQATIKAGAPPLASQSQFLTSPVGSAAASGSALPVYPPPSVPPAAPPPSPPKGNAATLSSSELPNRSPAPPSPQPPPKPEPQTPVLSLDLGPDPDARSGSESPPTIAGGADSEPVMPLDMRLELFDEVMETPTRSQHPTSPSSAVPPVSRGPKPSSERYVPRSSSPTKEQEPTLTDPTGERAKAQAKKQSTRPAGSPPGTSTKPSSPAAKTPHHPQKPFEPSFLDDLDEDDGDQQDQERASAAFAALQRRGEKDKGETRQTEAPAATTRQTLPLASATRIQVPAKKSPALLIALVVVFVVFPVAFLLMPEQKKGGVLVDPAQLERLLEQQHQVIEEMNATPEPSVALPYIPSYQAWQLRQENDQEEIEIGFEGAQSGLGSGTISIRGRKFAALLQYDPKVPDQPILFLREVVVKDLRPEAGGVRLRGEGEALVTSGSVPYRIGLDALVTAEMGKESVNLTVEVKGRKNGAPASGGQGIEQIGLGEFRVGLKRSFVLKPRGSQADIARDAPTSAPQSAATPRSGSYQRIPMIIGNPTPVPPPPPRGR